MKRFVALVVGLSLFCLAGHSLAQKMYKIVGADGSVTYSQTPPLPAQQKEGASVESLKSAAGGRSSVTGSGRNSYCGSVRLPSVGNDGDYARIVRSAQQWEGRLSSLVAKVRRKSDRYRYDSNNFQRYMPDESTQKAMRDLRCAIHWAESFDEQMNRSSDRARGHVGRLESGITDKKNEMAEVCGEEPYEGTEDALTWRYCARAYLSDIRQMERQVKDEQSKIMRPQ